MIGLHGRDVAIAFTAGIDSTVLAYWLCDEMDKFDKDFFHPVPQNHKPELHLLSCNYGQKTWERTRTTAEWHAGELNKRYGDKIFVKSVTLDVALPHWTKKGGLFQENYQVPVQKEIVDHHADERRYADCYVDGLNCIMYAWMMAYCSDVKISYLLAGHQFEVNEWDNFDGYIYRTDDSTPFFLDRMNLMNECGFMNRCRVEAPFSTMRLSKYDIVSLGQRLKVDWTKTFSCQFEPGCGKCDNCIIRRKAFSMLAITVP